MSGLAALPALALADFRDRVRRRSFLAVMAAAAFLGLQAVQGRIVVAVGGFTGDPSSAWAGALMTMVAGTFLSLAGFWVIKGSVFRDRSTGVGQILAATPMSKVAYTLAKAASHFLVLAAMVGVLALAAVVLLLVSPGAPPIQPLAILSPLALFALPGLALVAALAVLFETLPPLARGFGNFVWFFVWGALLVVPLETGALDLLGIATFQAAMGEAVRGIDPGYESGFVITLAGDAAARIHGTFTWDGLAASEIPWRERAQVLALALLVATAAALPFDRFDPARRRRRRGDAAAPVAPLPAAQPPAAAGAALAPLEAPSRRPRIISLALAELRVALAAQSRLWRLGAAGLAGAGLLVPASALPGLAIAALLWSALVWSGLGVRERELGIEPILAAAPRARSHQLPALLLAGAVLGLAPASGVLARMLAAGELAFAGSFVIGAVAMALLGLALGLLSGSSRLFEGLYITLWYLGPANRVPAFDYAGMAPGAAASPARFLLASVVLLALALVVERRRGIDQGVRFA